MTRPGSMTAAFFDPVLDDALHTGHHHDTDAERAARHKQRADARQYVCRAWPGMTPDRARRILDLLGLWPTKEEP